MIAQSWEDSVPEEIEDDESSEEWISGRTTIAKAFSVLLQQAWFKPARLMVHLTFIKLKHSLLLS